MEFRNVNSLYPNSQKIEGYTPECRCINSFGKKTTNCKWNKYQYTLSAQESSLESLTIIMWSSQPESEERGSEVPVCWRLLCWPDGPASHQGHVCQVSQDPFPLDCWGHAAKCSPPTSFLLRWSTPNPRSDGHILSLDMLI